MNAVRCLVAAFALGALAAPALAEDLTSLPEYRPGSEVSGVLRVRGSNHAGSLMKLWGQGFRKHHPQVTFENTLKGDASAMIGLEESIADLVVMTRQIVPYDTYGLWRRSHRTPIEIVVATGSHDAPDKAEALTVFVHKDNPLSQLTLQQLDGIFGAQRTGGWKGMEWDPSAARSEAQDLRTWGQLGLTGEWKDKPIVPYGPPATFPGGMSFFQIRVMGGADSRAEKLREYPDSGQMMKAMANDRYGIAYAGMSSRTSESKPIALADRAGDPHVDSTRENTRQGRYPLARSVYVYLPPDSPAGDPLEPRVDPRVREFLRYVLSKEGQEDVEREGDYLPLNAAVVRRQLDILR